MSFLRLNNVCKAFGNNKTLASIDLEIKQGETVAVIGPSGCGKTTLLRSIALLDPIDDGIIIFDGNVVAGMKNQSRPQSVNPNAYRQRVGMVFQHLHVWPNRTVLGNLSLAPHLVRNRPIKEVNKQAMALLERMGIAEKAQVYPETLSGGQQQRVALARALMMEPDVLLLDEITSALDPEIVGDILDIIAELSKGGMTMVIVTHEMQFASEVSNRIVFMDEGKVVEQGTPEDVLARPESARLKSFLNRVRRHRICEAEK